jgi:aldehyde:ferredoxin oxidoreductase
MGGGQDLGSRGFVETEPRRGRRGPQHEWVHRQDIARRSIEQCDPPRTRQPHVSGTLNEKPVDPEVLDHAATLYYGMMGWDPETGVPTEAKLHELDVAWPRPDSVEEGGAIEHW